MEFTMNSWCFLAIVIIAWCIKEIIKHIAYCISVTKSVRRLTEIPDDQRGIMIKYLFNKKMKDLVDDENKEDVWKQ